MAKGRKTGGRTKGQPNRVTAEKRAFLQAFVEGNREKAELLWSQIEDPAQAFKLYLNAAEFVHSKKSSVDVSGEDGGAIIIHINKYAEDQP